MRSILQQPGEVVASLSYELESEISSQAAYSIKRTDGIQSLLIRKSLYKQGSPLDRELSSSICKQEYALC